MEQWSVCTAERFKNVRWELALRGALVSRGEGRVRFALPYRADLPFPLPELMCFAKWERIFGSDRIIYTFDAEKNPIF